MFEGMAPMHRLFVVFLALLAPVLALAQEPAVYKIGPGDILSLVVHEEASLSGEYKVRETGAVEIPIVGRVEIGGLSQDEATAAITAALTAKYLKNPHVSVEIKTYASQPVQVLGAVRTPGTFFLKGPTTLLDILSLAGGVLAEKSSQEVHIKRASGGEPITVDLARLLTQGEGNLILEPNDVVLIKEGEFVYVNGEVSKPGAVGWKSGLSLSQAVAAAGGANRTAALRTVYVVREGKTITVNLKSVLKGKEADFPVRPGDQVYLGESVL